MSGLLGILGRNEMVAQPAEKHETKQTINTDSREVAEAGSLTDLEPTDSVRLAGLVAAQRDAGGGCAWDSFGKRTF